MNRVAISFIVSTVLILGVSSLAPAQTWGLTELSKESKACIDCHKTENPAIYQQWGSSKHFRGNIGCYECHAAKQDDADAFMHEGQWIATIVSPKDCARCHATQTREFAESHHSKAARIVGSLDNVLAEVVEGNHGLVTPAFQTGVSAAAVSGCWQCHGSEIKVLPGGKLDPATWPNTGIGRLNPDASEGSCSACHSRHAFSAEQARNPDNCGKCHMGPDHPQMEIYYESKHGIAFRAYKDKLHLDSAKWIVGEDYSHAPTCATCHMSATRKQPVSHDVGLRISWNNRPEISIRPEISDKKLGLPSASVDWQTRRANMKDVCRNCHEQQWVENFYVQYDGVIEQYHEKFAKPGLELYGLAKPLLRPVSFSNRLDFAWYEIWHHEGRRARHGASMMGPDYTHWHGTYEVAKHFYAEFVPELEALAREAKASGDPKKAEAADALRQKLDAVLNSTNHAWFLDKMDPAEKEQRRKQMEEFRKRYEK
ncbi:MAG TPA: multiheme c-type cytochrome [Phycisphaerae bacterium]|nr:multiheme c-type cytochrome [Phycisphaerae bacterium]